MITLLQPLRESNTAVAFDRGMKRAAAFVEESRRSVFPDL
jgi:hypothetical protein